MCHCDYGDEKCHDFYNGVLKRNKWNFHAVVVRLEMCVLI